jgi:hypothetical protein
MPLGAATAADVPTRYDVVIAAPNGTFGYVLLDTIEPNIPFRTHRAVYGQTQPFVERQNMSNSYGDNAQDFFLTIRQRDWSLGEQQKYFRTGQDGRYWMGSGVEVSTPGQVTLSKTMAPATFGEVVRACVRDHTNDDPTKNLCASAGSLYSVDAVGNLVNLGAHGLGAGGPARWGMANDNNATYLSTTAAGSAGVRMWNGAAFSTFSASGADSLAYLNNTLYGFRTSNFDLVRWDTAGVLTSLFTWRAAGGGAGGFSTPRLVPFGGKLLIGSVYAQESSELWIFDGVGVSRLEVLPENFIISDMDVLYGVAYIAGAFIRRSDATHLVARPAVLFYDGSQIGLLWRANDYNTATIATTSLNLGPYPALGVNDGRLVFTDETNGNLMAYNPALGGVSSVASFTPNTGDSCSMASSPYFVLHTRNQAMTYYFPSTSYPASGYVISSLIDFDSSLPKVFRGVTVEFDLATDGNGGSVDVAYQLDSLVGAWTTLATGVTSGLEVTFPANTSGHAVAIKITLNKGTSTAGPTLKAMNVRGAAIMPIYPRGEYILDCGGTASQPRELRDGSWHPLTGYEMVQNLIVARNSTTPITITDKVNGTFIGFIDVNDPQGFDVYEVHPAPEDNKRPGSYIVRLTVRGV